ncbi:MAG: TIGR02757 family protein [Candidatus Brocadiia bacterium]
MAHRITGPALEALYRRLNRRQLVHPDPLEVLYAYPRVEDRELAALVAACLAYGRVTGILRSVRGALGRMPSPRAWLAEATPAGLRAAFAGFRHRFATGVQLAALLLGSKRLIERHGSLNEAFAAHLEPGHATVVPALAGFADELRRAADGLDAHLLPCPRRGSACKRLALFLRWMVRRDAVDPGGWTGVSAAQLIVPLDTHMHRICRALGLVARRSADLRAAEEATASFRRFAPHDPVRYDFALTRLGIRPEADLGAFLKPYVAPKGVPR